MKTITPVAEISRQGPAAANVTLPLDAEITLVATRPRPKAKQPVAELVAGWAAEMQAAAPARHHRDFGEYMLEALPELVKRLEDRDVS